MGNKIIKADYLLLEEGLKRNWGVKVNGDVIIQVAPNEEIVHDDGDEVFYAEEQIILPGFVNGHNHMYGFLSHGITADAVVTEFSSFLEDFWWPYVEDRMNHELVAATTKWACVEMIDSGVTSFVDILEGPNSIPHALEIEREIVQSAGLRGKLSFEACERVSKENAKLGLEENISFIKKHNNKGSLVEGKIGRAHV